MATLGAIKFQLELVDHSRMAHGSDLEAGLGQLQVEFGILDLLVDPLGGEAQEDRAAFDGPRLHALLDFEDTRVAIEAQIELGSPYRCKGAGEFHALAEWRGFDRDACGHQLLRLGCGKWHNQSETDKQREKGTIHGWTPEQANPDDFAIEGARPRNSGVRGNRNRCDAHFTRLIDAGITNDPVNPHVSRTADKSRASCNMRARIPDFTEDACKSSVSVRVRPRSTSRC